MRLAALTLLLTLSTLAADIKSINGPLVPAGTDGDFVFIAAGDNRPTGKGAPMPRVLRTIFGEVRLIRPAFAIWSGDVVYGYDDTPAELAAEYDAFIDRAKVAAVPIFNAPGNHEIHNCKPGDPEAEFVSHFGSLYGSFDYRGAHFIALDTEDCTDKLQVPKAQFDWLKKDLEDHQSARAIFVFFHTEMWQSNHDQTAANHPPLINAPKLHKLFQDNHVTAVFQGHEHVFDHMRYDGIDYFVAGGAGAPKYANPENNGFSHYIVVQMKSGGPSYTVVEPGHLYAEDGSVGTLQPPPNVWLVNSSNTTLPVAGLETSVPASLGACADLVSDNGKITSCVPNGAKLDLTIAIEATFRKSIPISIRKK